MSLSDLIVMSNFIIVSYKFVNVNSKTFDLNKVKSSSDSMNLTVPSSSVKSSND